jgi:Flp pilus assembly pilin Flp
MGDAQQRRICRCFQYGGVRRAPPGAYDPEEIQLLHEWSIRLYLALHRDRGQTMAEYAVVLAVIAIGIFVALGSLRGSISGALGKVTSDI